MKLLLDTHALLWWLNGSSLDPEAQRLIADRQNVVYVSAASVWEVSIKQSLGELRVDGDVMEHIVDCGFLDLPITSEHGLVAGQLPGHHRDPFDRMLIAQAQSEGLSVVTRDAEFSRYDVRIVAV